MLYPTNVGPKVYSLHVWRGKGAKGHRRERPQRPQLPTPSCAVSSRLPNPTRLSFTRKHLHACSFEGQCCRPAAPSGLY